jgi:hypothetical protein
MSAKRKPVELDPAEFASAAVPQPNPVDQLVSKSTPPAPTLPVRKAPRRKERAERESGTTLSRQASRIGKVAVQTWVEEDLRVELRVVAARQRTTVEDLLREGIVAMVKKYSTK